MGEPALGHQQHPLTLSDERKRRRKDTNSWICTCTKGKRRSSFIVAAPGTDTMSRRNKKEHASDWCQNYDYVHVELSGVTTSRKFFQILSLPQALIVTALHAHLVKAVGLSADARRQPWATHWKSLYERSRRMGFCLCNKFHKSVSNDKWRF